MFLTLNTQHLYVSTRLHLGSKVCAVSGHVTPKCAEQVEMDAKRHRVAELHINTVLSKTGNDLQGRGGSYLDMGPHKCGCEWEFGWSLRWPLFAWHWAGCSGNFLDTAKNLKFETRWAVSVFQVYLNILDAHKFSFGGGLTIQLWMALSCFSSGQNRGICSKCCGRIDTKGEWWIIFLQNASRRVCRVGSRRKRVKDEARGATQLTLHDVKSSFLRSWRKTGVQISMCKKCLFLENI